MTNFPGPLFLTDTEGQRVAVQIPYSLWQLLEKHVDCLCSGSSDSSTQLPLPPEPLDAFDELMQYWDFRYPYNPAVTCPHCDISVEDWRKGTDRPFRLKNANLGGLLVFSCQKCGATIRQKNFKDHTALEFSPPASRQKS